MIPASRIIRVAVLLVLVTATFIIWKLASPANSQVTVIIGGDIMLDRNIRKLGQKIGYSALMDDLAPIFGKADIAVANLEGPVTTQPSKTILPDGSYTGSFIFTFDPESLEALKAAKISLVSLANNHTDNFYASGLEETKEHLAAADIKWFGDPWNRISTSTTQVIRKNGIDIAFIGYHAFQLGFTDIIQEIRNQADQGRFVIVMPHWGEEYVDIASDNLRQMAIKMVEAGAGAIIGSHPHVIMNHELIDGVPVYYSLGNLLFDQYFSQKTKKGIILELHIRKSGDQIFVEDITEYETLNSSQNGASLL